MSTIQTLRPNSTQQLGAWTVVGAANAHTATSDNNTGSYVQLVSKCRLDSQYLRLGFPAPTLPAGAQIFSVQVRRLVQTVVPPAPQPQCHHWFHCNTPTPVGLVTTLVVNLLKFFFGSRCPSQPTTQWIEEVLPAQLTDPNGNPWTVAQSFSPFYYSMGRGDENGNPLRVAEVYVDVAYVAQSTVTVTGPTGTITTTCRPTVTWTYANTDGVAQQAFRVAVYTAAQVSAPGFQPFVSTPTQESGWVQGEDLQWTLSADIVNGSWQAFVQAQQVWTGAGSFYSGTASTSWTQSIAGAPNAVLQSAVFDIVDNRVQLSMLPSSSSPTTVAYTVEVKRGPDGMFSPMRGGLLVPATGMTPVVLYDHEAPLNIPSYYRVLAYGQTGSLLFPAAGYSATLSVTPNINVPWVKCPANPLLNSALPVSYMGDSRTQRKVQAQFDPIAGDLEVNSIVISGPRYGFEGTLDLVFHHNQAEDYFTALQQLERSGEVLLFQWPNGEEFYFKFGPGAAGSDKTWTWTTYPRDHKKLTISYTQVDSPPITN